MVLGDVAVDVAVDGDLGGPDKMDVIGFMQ